MQFTLAQVTTLYFGGTLGGAGSIDSDLTVHDGGIIEPGITTGSFSAGSADFQAGSELSIEIASLENFDQLLLSQTLAIAPAATLNITILDGYAPNVGDEFKVLDFDSSTGVFETISTPSLNSGLAWDLSRLQDQGIISVVAGNSNFLLGDCDLDGFVNFLDISPFISILSTGGFLNEADINQDDDVNFLDISPFISILSGN